MKHKHHIIPRHMGGTNEPANIIELDIPSHAEAHRILYEKYGHWEDLLAWKGLLGIIPRDECILEAIRCGGLAGALRTNGGVLYTNGTTIQKFMPGEAPAGWTRHFDPKARKPGIGRGTKGRNWYHNPVNPIEKRSFLPEEQIPQGWERGQGRKQKVDCYWYNDGTEEGQFAIGNEPVGWVRGRTKGICASRKHRP